MTMKNMNDKYFLNGLRFVFCEINDGLTKVRLEIKISPLLLVRIPMSYKFICCFRFFLILRLCTCYLLVHWRLICEAIDFIHYMSSIVFSFFTFFSILYYLLWYMSSHLHLFICFSRHIAHHFSFIDIFFFNFSVWNITSSLRPLVV